MRIAFCGKGGSGKTTLSTLFTKWLLAQDLPVLAIDGDINQHLQESLGLAEEDVRKLPKLGREQGKLKEYVRGQNPRILAAEHVIESTPPGRGSRFIHYGDTDNEVWNYFGLKANNLTFMSIGGHASDEAATSCYHKYTAAEGVFLNHLIDGKKQYVVGDKVAGADPFASCGVASRYDMIVLVVEPTRRSLEVYNQVKEYSDQLGLDFYVVGNKVADADDIEFIKEKVEDSYIGSISHSEFVKKADKGIFLPIESLEEPNKELLATIHGKLDSIERDWKKYLKTGLTYHKIYAESWADQWVGTNLNDQVDPDFCYTQIEQ